MRTAKEENAEAAALVRQEFRSPSWEAVKAAAFMEVAEIATAMEIDNTTAALVRKAAREYIRDRWAFEESAGER